MHPQARLFGCATFAFGVAGEVCPAPHHEMSPALRQQPGLRPTPREVPMAEQRTTDPWVIARFWQKSIYQPANGCWEWTAKINSFGYGVFTPLLDGGKTSVMAHRFAYELLIGPIPAGYQLDHLCRNRRCVNPNHLDPVSPALNNARSTSPSALNAAKSHCKRGHEFSPDNTYVTPDGRRMCRACMRYRDWKRRAQVA
jgi:hypothetical protein